MDLVLLPSDDARLAPSTDPGVARGFLAGAVDLDDEAGTHRDHVVAFIDREPAAAERATPEGHLTGSALVVDARGERTLLMLHRKLGRWFQPGGHCDGDTNLASVALKEAGEETGIVGLRVVPTVIDVDVHRVAPPGEEPHLHLDTRFLVVAPPGATEVGNEESLALRWVDEAGLDDLDPPIDPGTRRLVRVGLAAARSILAPAPPER
jgi:8-oxo-dGTP pyrophosphatase MutT (NUDIX family)